MTKHILPLCLALLLFSAAPAMAAYIDLGVAGEYNAFLFNDFSMNSEQMHGRLAVDGNVTLSYYAIGVDLPSGSSGSALVASGDVNMTGGTVYGDVTAGGAVNADATADIKGTAYGNAALPFNFSVAEAYLSGLSTGLSALASNGLVSDNYGSLILSGDNTSLFQVFNVDGQDLLDAHGLTLDQIAENATVLINVSGLSSGLTNMSLFNFAEYSDSVLFNFYEAIDVTLAGIKVKGSILAPVAGVNATGGEMYGTLIASSLEGHFELHDNPFDGGTPVPEPGTFVIMGLGLLALALFMRRRGRA